jgi:hypothetical protein
MQNFPWAEAHNSGPLTAVQFSPTTPPAHLPEQSILDKSDGLIRMRIDQSSSQSTLPRILSGQRATPLFSLSPSSSITIVA